MVYSTFKYCIFLICSIVFSQKSFYLNSSFGESNILYNNEIINVPGFNKGENLQFELGLENMMGQILFTNGLFYRKSTNSLNISWIDYVDDEYYNKFKFSNKIIGLSSNIGYLLPINNFFIEPKTGLNIGYIYNQTFINPLYSQGVSINYENILLNKYKNNLQLFDDFYLSTNLTLVIGSNYKKINFGFITFFEVQLNQLFDNEIYKEYYLNFNTGIYLKYRL